MLYLAGLSLYELRALTLLQLIISCSKAISCLHSCRTVHSCEWFVAACRMYSRCRHNTAVDDWVMRTAVLPLLLGMNRRTSFEANLCASQRLYHASVRNNISDQSACRE
jgi:hypothetical protein